jgi:hypothetical protein
VRWDYRENEGVVEKSEEWEGRKGSRMIATYRLCACGRLIIGAALCVDRGGQSDEK